MKKLILLLGLILVPLAKAQPSNPSIILVTTAPAGSCSNGLPNQQVVSTGVQYSCQGGTWGTVGAGAGGPPTGAAGGDLGGTYPNPTVVGVHTVSSVLEASGSPLTVTAITGIWWNNTASAYSFKLAAPIAGLQQCFGNYQARASAVSIIPPTGVTIYFKGVAGTISSATGLVSSGAAGDFICVVGTDATTYMAIGGGFGAWVNN